MSPSSDASRDVILERLAAEFVERQRRGERPPLSEYADRHPDLATDIRDLFPALVQIEKFKPTADAGAAVGASAPGDPKSERLGDYRILRRVGHGGMGVVYEAEQESLGRRVALKVLPSSALLNPTYLERFRRESKAAARLHHTNIVPVFGVGDADGVHFYAMQFIDGEGLDTVLADVRRLRRTAAAGDTPEAPQGSVARGLVSGTFSSPAVAAPVPPSATPDPSSATSRMSAGGTEVEYYRGVARVGAQVADALAYAHRQGILHRDVKPSNLLLDMQGTVWVTDFGLAKAEGSDELTHTGDIVGTIRFMAPERFEGQSLPQSDVYGLGLTLYEMLTLRPAFEDGNKGRLIEKVLNEPPAPPRQIDPRIPRDLETVVLKCLAKDPRERYATAEAMAEDLLRFLADRPIRARRTSWRERGWRWCRRNPWVAGLSAAVLLLLTLTAVGGVVMTVRLNDSLLKAQEEEREGKRKLLLSYLSDADANRMSRRPGQRFNTLRRVREALELGAEIGLTAEDKLKLRNIAIAALCLPDLDTPEERTDAVRLAGEQDPVHRRYLRAISILQELPPPAFELHGTSWVSPDGRYIAVATKPYVKTVTLPVRIWRIDGDRPVPVLDETTGVYEEAVSFRPDGREVAFGHADGSVSIWDLETKACVRRLDRGPDSVFCLAYHPTLPRLAIACGSEVAVWDTAAGTRLARLQQGDECSAVTWHPRGHRLASAGASVSTWQIYLWDAETWQPVSPPWQGLSNGGIHLAFSHAGDRLVSFDWSGIVRLWDTASGELLLSRSASGFPHFGADDRTILGASLNSGFGTLRVAGGQELRVLQRPTPLAVAGLWNCTLHPGGRLLAANTTGGRIFFDLLTGEEVGFAAGNFSATHASFDSTGAFWSAGGAGLVRWPVRVGESQGAMRIGPPEWVADLLQNGHDGYAHSANGGVVTVPLYGRGARVIHVSPPRRTLRLGPQNDVRGAPVSNDGRWVVTATHTIGGSVRYKLWEADTGRLVTNLPYPEVSVVSGFSPDSRWLYIHGKDGERRVEIASLVGMRPVPDEPSQASAWKSDWKAETIRLGGAFSPDGRLRAYGTSEGTIRLVVPETDEEIARLSPSAENAAYPQTFSPDGSLLLAVGTKKLCVFDLHLIRTQLAELGLDWDDVQPRPQRSKEYDPARVVPLRVEMIDAEAAGSREKMAEAERRRAVWQLFLNPFDADAHFRLGLSLSVLGNNAEAFNHLSAALAFDPELEEARFARAETASRLGRWDDVVADTDRYLAKVPFDLTMRLAQARANHARKRHEDAVADYTALIAASPGNPAYRDERAVCYEALAKPDLAQADRAQSRKLGGLGGQTLNDEAWRLVTGPVAPRDPAKALGLVRKALEVDPDNAQFQTTLGVVQYRHGRFREAADTLQKSLAGGGGARDAFDLYFLALCHVKLGDLGKARDCFDRAVKWVPPRKAQSPQLTDELKAIRTEAEEGLRAPRPPS